MRQGGGGGGGKGTICCCLRFEQLVRTNAPPIVDMFYRSPKSNTRRKRWTPTKRVGPKYPRMQNPRRCAILSVIPSTTPGLDFTKYIRFSSVGVPCLLTVQRCW